MTSASPVPRHRAPSSVRTAMPAVLAAAVVATASIAGSVPLLVAVLVVQIGASAGVLLLADVPRRRESAGLAAVAAVGADLLAAREHGERIGDLVAVVALSVVAAVLLELVRRDRTRVTESLAATVTSVVLVAMAAQLLTLRATTAGPDAVAVALGAVAVGLLAGGVVELIAHGPVVATGSRRGVLGVVVTTGVAAAVGAVAGGRMDALTSGTAAMLAMSCAAAAAVGGLVVEMSCADVAPARGRAASGPLGAALPVVLAAPVAYAVSRLVIG